MSNYICKIASLEEMNEKWDYEIEIATNKENWIIWKMENLDYMQKGKIIPYYGILNGKIISEATANIDSNIVQNSQGLVDNTTVYLSAFRTNKEYQGQGYFSKLFKYMINDLKEKGYKNATVGVEPCEVKNIQIYFKYGFDKFIKADYETYPDGTKTLVLYYAKDLN